MPDQALVIGGARSVGRHTVAEFLGAGYEVTLFDRPSHENPFPDRERVDHVEGDRGTEADIRRVGLDLSPDVVVDCLADKPRHVHAATDIFADTDAYVYVSSGDVYAAEQVPKREGETPLRDCPVEAATDDGPETYGQRKAEGDRAVFAAADRGVNAMSVRPPDVYGPHDDAGRFGYWIDRVRNHDRVVVPGDGTNLGHLAFVGDVASAIRTVVESGTPGEAYNVGDGHVPTLGEWVELLAEACGTDVEPVFASDRELGAVDLSLGSFPLYRSYPNLLETTKLRSLGWAPTPREEALAAMVEAHGKSDRTGRDEGPDRETEARLIEVLATVA